LSDSGFGFSKKYVIEIPNPFAGVDLGPLSGIQGFGLNIKCKYAEFVGIKPQATQLNRYRAEQSSAYLAGRKSLSGGDQQ